MTTTTSKAESRSVGATMIDAVESDLAGFRRSIAKVSTLLIVLSLAYPVFSDIGDDALVIYTGIVVAFASGIAVQRLWQNDRPPGQLQLTVEALAMTFFVSALVWLTGGTESLLTGLYLLPLVVAAIALGPAATVGMLAVVFLSMAGIELRSALDLPGWRHAVRAAFAFAPVVLITYVAALLAGNIRTTRERIVAMSERDDLTRLYNMRAFMDRLAHTHRMASRHGHEFGVIMVDIDSLKPINDRHGHSAGNRAIQLVADAISRCIRQSDIAARYGGDEFVVLLPQSDAQAADRAMRRIRNSVFATSLKLDGQIIRVTASVGLAVFPHDGGSPKRLLAAADEAMYADKGRRRDSARLPESLKDSA